jgi:uncharacterized protein YfaS (alpha-2-macroglobulin family)
VVQKMPILPHGVERFEAKNGLIASGEARFGFSLPAGFDRSSARLELRIASGFAQAVQDGVKYLVEYPYGCTGQTLNRLLPNLVARETFQALGVAAPVPEAEFAAKMKEGIARLAGLQHETGGFGWWKEDADDPFMTALAVYGLARGRELDLPVEDKVLSAGLARARGFLARTEITFPQRAWMLLALSEAKADVTAEADKLFDTVQRAEADPYTKALLLVVFSRIDRKSEAGAIAQELVAAAKPDAGGLWWGDAGSPRWNADPVEVTAWAATALHAFDKRHPAIEKALAWIMLQRRGGSWKSTRDTAAAVLAFCRYLESAGGIGKAPQIAVVLNGKAIAGGEISAGATGSLVAVHGSALAEGPNELVLRQEAGPAAFYSALATWYSEEENVKAAEAGVSVARSYYVLEPGEEGGKKLWKPRRLADGEAVESGALLMAVVEVSAREDQQYFLLMDPLPATAQVEERDASFEVAGRPEGPKATREIHDESVVFFLHDLYSNVKTTFSYLFRATVKGTFHAMPAQGELMYFPHVRGISDERVFEVK